VRMVQQLRAKMPGANPPSARTKECNVRPLQGDAINETVYVSLPRQASYAHKGCGLIPTIIGRTAPSSETRWAGSS
jgi:hypothetical protein